MWMENMTDKVRHSGRKVDIQKGESGYWNEEEKLSEENLMAFFITKREEWNK